MKTNKTLRALGIAAVAAAGLSNGGNAAPTNEEGGRTIDRLNQIRADYLKALGKPEGTEQASVEVAQWQNFNNWGNG
jgi:hypothetical protein